MRPRESKRVFLSKSQVSNTGISRLRFKEACGALSFSELMARSQNKQTVKCSLLERTLLSEFAPRRIRLSHLTSAVSASGQLVTVVAAVAIPANMRCSHPLDSLPTSIFPSIINPLGCTLTVRSTAMPTIEFFFALAISGLSPKERLRAYETVLEKQNNEFGFLIDRGPLTETKPRNVSDDAINYRQTADFEESTPSLVECRRLVKYSRLASRPPKHQRKRSHESVNTRCGATFACSEGSIH